MLVEDVARVVWQTLRVDPKLIRPDDKTRLLGAISELDSMAVVSVVAALEDAFDIVVDDEDLSADTFETLGSLADLVARKKQG